MDEPPANTILVSILSDSYLINTLSFVAIALLLLLSALISASEVAFFSIDPESLLRFHQSGTKKEKRVAALLDKPRELLASILIAHGFTNVAVITSATFLMWEMTGTHDPVSFAIALFVFCITLGIIFFGEIIPKAYATKNNVGFAGSTASLWHILIILFKPFSSLLLLWSDGVEKRFIKKGYQTTVDELNQALDLAAVNDESTADEKEILKGIVNFGMLTVKQVMRSRMDLSAADSEMNFLQLMEYVNRSGFSRIPVYRESLDKIEGVLYIKDLLPFMDQGESFEWQRLLRPGFFVPETKKIDALLKDFQEKRVHIALVVDEYGGTSGLITMEDIIEEIIGDINDEFDEVGTPYQKIDEQTFIFEGKTSLNDFCKELGIDINTFDEVKGESESLGGLMLELKHELPKPGDQISYEQFTFTTESVDRKRVKKIKVHIHEQEER